MNIEDAAKRLAEIDSELIRITAERARIVKEFGVVRACPNCGKINTFSGREASRGVFCNPACRQMELRRRQKSKPTPKPILFS